jgi:hypothetical protein
LDEASVADCDARTATKEDGRHIDGAIGWRETLHMEGLRVVDDGMLSIGNRP